MKLSFLLGVVSIAFYCSACSLNYGTASKTEASFPEFIFENARFERISDNTITVQMQAKTIERYKRSATVYAKDIHFTTYDTDNQKETEGTCHLLEASPQDNTYTFFDAIDLYNYKQKLRILTDCLYWNTDTEQVTGASGDGITIQYTANGETSSFKGNSFSASTISNTFSIADSVYGNITNENKN